MHTEDSIEIHAPVDVVWQVYADVERWPSWTPSMRSVELVGGGGLAVGAQARIDQPRLPRVTWTVTELTPGRSWTWEARGPGNRTVAHHELTPVDSAATRVATSIDQNGPVGALFGRLYAGLTRRYLRMEAERLKATCEAPAEHPAPGA
jgi:uncharacterized membrane protein